MSATWLICAIAVFLFTFTNTFNTVAAQRSPYAGSRPGGLDQRDKYHIPQNSNATMDIASRFGMPENNIPFGTAQRPPVGLPVVMPEGAFVPLQPAPAVASGVNNNAISFAQRLGETATNTQNLTGGAGLAQPQVPTTQQQPQVPAPAPALAPLPLDANGDRELINRLSMLPEDKRPFWFLNYQAIEAQRNSSAGFNSGLVQSRGSFSG